MNVLCNTKLSYTFMKEKARSIVKALPRSVHYAKIIGEKLNIPPHHVSEAVTGNRRMTEAILNELKKL